jgi:hypothetical protein
VANAQGTASPDSAAARASSVAISVDLLRGDRGLAARQLYGVLPQVKAPDSQVNVNDARESGAAVERMQKPESDEANLAGNSLTATSGADAGGGPSEKLKEAAAAIAAKLGKKYDINHIGDRGVGGGMNFYSVEKEVALGQEMSHEVEQSAKLFNDPVINEYVNRLAQNLVRNSDARVPFTVKIVDSDEVNAFALPGGFFYVNTGLIMAADNEAELAGVMAHEIAHVAARHATKTASKRELWSIMSIPLVFVGGPAGMAVQNFMGLAVPLTFLKFGRNAEREADLLGIQYQYAAGYDPNAMVNFLEKLQDKDKKRPNFVSRAFSTHPMNDDRIKQSQKVMSALPEHEEYLVTTSEFEEVKARLASLTGTRVTAPGESSVPTLRKSTGDQNMGPKARKLPQMLGAH